MEKDDKGSTMIRMGVSGWMFLLVPAYPGCPGSKAVKRSLLFDIHLYNEAVFGISWQHSDRMPLAYLEGAMCHPACKILKNERWIYIKIDAQWIDMTENVSWMLEKRLLPYKMPSTPVVKSHRSYFAAEASVCHDWYTQSVFSVVRWHSAWNVLLFQVVVQ